MYYGNTNANKLARPYRRYYSADGTMEITYTTATGAVEFMTYIGGDPYTAPMVQQTKFATPATTTPTKAIFYLHRDYQGSILAVSNSAGALVEKRLFDAWGEIVLVKDGAGNILPKLTFFDRGYTGHEHLQGVGLIHMNGRLYDAKLHRFLQPDNYVQDPYNTQNYNRYGYVLNNPLKYTDPSGEEFITAVIIAVAVAITSYTLTAMYADVPFTAGGLAKAAIMGAISGAVTAGIAQGVSTICNFANEAVGFWQGAYYGATQGFFTGITSTSLNTLSSGGSLKLGQLLKAGLIGAAIGGIINGIDAGARAKEMGLNYWGGDGTVDSLCDVTITGDQAVEYSTESAQNFSNSHEELNRLSENVDNLHADGSVPENYVNKNGYLYNPKGQPINGVTEYKKTGFLGLGKKEINVYLSKSAFVSKPQLYMTTHHEYMHAYFYAHPGSLPIDTKNFDFQHMVIHQWQYDQYQAWNKNLLSLGFKNSGVYSNPSKTFGVFLHHYSKFNFKIINYIP